MPLTLMQVVTRWDSRWFLNASTAARVLQYVLARMTRISRPKISATSCYKQIIPLHEGDNMFGRYNKGTVISNPIETSDPSMDRRHCIINVKRGYAGDLTYTIRDNQSVTGTFVMNRILGNRERLLIEDGAIITLGATTLILHTADSEE